MEKTTEFKTEKEYKEARRKLDIRDKHAQAYREKHRTNGIPMEVYSKFPYDKEVTNSLRSAIETYEFFNDPPEKYFVYIDEKKETATTWTGQILGKVTFLNSFISNMGDTRRSLRLTCNNGVKYTGTFYKSSGDYARIKISK